MSTLGIELAKEQGGYRPGEHLRGAAGWALDRQTGAAAIELRLVWFTEGKGDQDVEIVAHERWERPAPDDQKTFDFRLPAGPYSFSGKLVTLVWALELVVLPKGESAQKRFTLSPSGEEISLGAAEGPAERFGKKKKTWIQFGQS